MKKPVVLILFLALSICLSAAPKHLLEYKIKKGTQVKQKLSSVVTSKIDFSALEIGEQEVETTFSIWQNSEIIAVDDKLFTAQITIPRIKVNMTVLGTLQSIDTDNQDDQNNALLQDFINKPFVITYNTTGKVESLGDGNIFNTNVDSYANNKVSNELLLNVIKSNLEQISSVFPDYPVAIGDSWSKELEVKSMYALNLKNEFTLKSVKGNIVTLEASGVLWTDNEDKGISVDKSESKIILNGTYKGVYRINTKTGAVTCNVEQKTKGTLLYEGLLNIPILVDVVMKMSEE